MTNHDNHAMDTTKLLELLELWASEFGNAVLAPEDVAAKASPRMRAVFAKELYGQVTPAGIAGFLPKIARIVTGGELRLESSVSQGRSVWNVEHTGKADEREREEEDNVAGVTMSLQDGRLELRAETQPPDHTAAIIEREPTPAELLAGNLVKSLRRHSEILDFPVDPEDFRMTRIISDTATSIIGIAARSSGEQLRFQRDKNREISPRFSARIELARDGLERKS